MAILEFVLTGTVISVILGVMTGAILGIQPGYIRGRSLRILIRALQLVFEFIVATLEMLTPIAIIILIASISKGACMFRYGVWVGVVLSTFLAVSIKWRIKEVLSDVSSIQIMLFGYSQFKLIKKLIKSPMMLKSLIIPGLINSAVYLFLLHIVMEVLVSETSYGGYLLWSIILPDSIGIRTLVFMIAAFLTVGVYSGILLRTKEKNNKGGGKRQSIPDDTLVKIEKDTLLENRYFRLENENDIFIRKGEIVWLKGPSGSGKSMLGRLISEQPIKGFDRVYYEKIIRQNDRVFYLFQEPSLFLFPYLPIGRFYREITGETLQCDNKEKEKRFPIYLNAGFKREVSMKMVKRMVDKHNIDLLILDEPDASLDLCNQKKLLDDIKELKQKKQGLSVIYITHNITIGEALKRCWKNDFRIIEVNENKINGMRVSSISTKNEISLPVYSLNYNIDNGFKDYPGLDIKGLSVKGIRIDGKNILDNASFSLDNKIVFIIGRNGRGKSVFLKSIVGVIKRKVKSLKYNKEKELKGFSVQDISPDYIVLVMDDIERAFPDWIGTGSLLRSLGIKNNYEERPFTTYSGGERQRIIIEEVLPHILRDKRQVVLLDEPFSRLDSELLLILLQKILTKNNSFIIVTHNIMAINKIFTNVQNNLKSFDEISHSTKNELNELKECGNGLEDVCK